MHDDGDIDYSRYNLRELEEALAGINRQKYPQNYANLLAAYERVKERAIPASEAAPLSPTSETERPDNALGDFWSSRPVRAAGGVFCVWWSYDLFTKPDCSAGRRLTSLIVRFVCETFGHRVAAGLPFVLGLTLVYLAIFPRRRATA